MSITLTGKKGLELVKRKLNFIATSNLLKCITQPADVIMYMYFSGGNACMPTYKEISQTI